MSAQPIPADQVFALYDNAKKVLTLSAKGAVQPVTSDIHFIRLPWAGGLRFALVGRTLAVMGPLKPYEVSNDFNIELSPVVLPSGKVVVETAGKQWIVEVHALGLKPTLLAAGNESLPEIETVPSNDQKIVVYDKTPFQVKQPIQFAKLANGTISLDYDKTFATLQNAGISNGTLEWTFLAEQTGNTQISVLVAQNDPPFAYRVLVDVEVILPLGPGNAKPETIVSLPIGQVANGSNGIKAH
ncbi:hypothetical protein Micbo1qcDRAFT_216515 [Microdochium bolleyi]|uniref:Uncharacterized protein n=1 Tax=Microdochium bolleyi TaxID=196109 RepID=A0A136IR41_9PEZI|nr:hypothetical protein Micbo1qcDRAFT_216515 [Microdochium bolleyi]